MEKYFYAADYDLHPQYASYWIHRFVSRKDRDAWQGCRSDRAILRADSPSVRYAKRHGAFYDTSKMVPDRFF